MNAQEIRQIAASFLNNDTDGDATNRLVVTLCSEIAAQLAEANQLARLRLRIEYIGPKTEFMEQL